MLTGALLVSLFAATPFSQISAASEIAKEKESATAIRVTPPAPVFDDKARQAELAERRARVAKEIGAKGMMILFGAEPRVFTGDVDYEYRQENNLFYLTHLNQRDATLVLMPGNGQLREILFLRRRDPARETWDGFMYSPEDARRIAGISEIWDVREFEPFIAAMRSRQAYRPKDDMVLMSSSVSTASGATTAPSTAAAPSSVSATEYESLFAAGAKNEAALYLLEPPKDGKTGEYRDVPEWRRERRFADTWKGQQAGGFTIRSAWPILSAMRLRKSASELQRLQHAIDITAEALGRAMAAAGRSQWEYEVEAEVEYTFKRRNAFFWGYPSIVGCGPNATTLHYNESQGRITPNDLLLMDVGAEYDHYTADITRTFPVSGRFTPAQTEIYNIVLAAQEAGMRATRPGGKKSDVHNAATEVIKDGLLKLGLITDRDSKTQYRMWFMHGTSHWLGMNVHDVGDNNAVLEPGMVFTDEPGIYIRADALDYLPKTPENEKFITAVRPAFEKYKNIGVRIEDDILVTAEGYRNLSAALPRTIPDIEAFITRASRELKVSATQFQPNMMAGHHVEMFLGIDGKQFAEGHKSWLTPRPLCTTHTGQTHRRGFVFVGSTAEYTRNEHHQHNLAIVKSEEKH